MTQITDRDQMLIDLLYLIKAERIIREEVGATDYRRDELDEIDRRINSLLELIDDRLVYDDE